MSMELLNKVLPKRPDGSIDVDAVRACADLDTAEAAGHQIMICGASTGHTWRVIAMCDTSERAAVLVAAIRALTESRK